jgi:hypothetical protein
MRDKILKYSKLPESEISKVSKDHIKEVDSLIAKFEREVNSLEELFDERPRISISLSNFCDKGCSHCIADSNLNGGMMSFEDFSKVPERFFRIFSYADYGRTGDPMLYESCGKDLADVISFLANYELRNHTIASGIFVYKEMNELIEKIKRVKDQSDLSIESLLTFHLYYPSLDHETLAKAFNKSIRKMARFSDRIILAVIGDTYFTETSLSSALNVFSENLGAIFEGLDLVERKAENTYLLRSNGRDTEIEIRTNPAIYPYGRFEKYLKGKGVYEDYLDNFPFFSKPLICPDTGRLPGIIIEYDGGINVCGSFEAVATKETVVGNLFGKTYDELEKLLLDFYRKEKDWVIENFDDILLGKKSTCKLCNRCYEL